jgi:cytochrome bd-type quinol oxidase subunit 1
MQGTPEQQLVKVLVRKIEELSLHMEKMKLAEYVHLLENLPRLLWINFITGIARGIGMAVGFTILGALLLYILGKLVNLPLIGSFIAEIVRIVQFQLGG